MDYDAAKDGHDSYLVAIEAKRQAGLAAIKREVTIGSCRLILGDSCDVMPVLGRFDALVCDPPYGIGEAAGKAKTRTSGLTSKLRNAQVYRRDYGDQNWDDKPAHETVQQAIAICRNAIIFGGNYYDLPPTSCWLVWDKLNGATDFADCELAWTNLKKAVRRIQFLWNGCMRGERHVERVHPTQKPIAVMEWCLSHLPTDARTVLDPFAGSGTTGVACVRRGLAFTGIERHEPYFDIMCRRIQEAADAPDMFISPARVPEPTQEAML